MNVNMLKISDAINYAAEKHATQRRKGSDTPYINHPLDLMNILVKNDVCDTDIICGAILHDIIEDTDGTYTELEELFGTKVASIVLECSDDKTELKYKRKLHQIQESKNKSIEAINVKLADKISNNQSLLNTSINWPKERIIGYILWSKAVVDSIGNHNLKLYGKFYEVYEELKTVYNIQDESKEALNDYIELIKKVS